MGKHLDFYSLYYMDEATSLDIDDFVDQLYMKALGSLKTKPFTSSLTKMGDDVFFNVKFPGMELKFTNNSYDGQKFLKDEASLKLWLKMSNTNDKIVNMSKLSESDVREILYKYFLDNKIKIVHELTHVFHGVTGQESNAGKYENLSDMEYANLPEEVDAYTTEIVHLIRDIVLDDPTFRNKLRLEIAKGRVWKYLISKVANDKTISKFLTYLTPDNEKKVLTRINKFLN